MTSSLSCSSAAMVTLPPASMRVPFAEVVASAMNALVVMPMTDTPTFTFTAAVPPKPPPTAIDVSFSLEFASTAALPVSVARTRDAIQASVCLVRTSTSIPAPTPAVPPKDSAPARLRTVVASLAATLRPTPETSTSWSMWAVVLCVDTFTTKEPATPAVPPPAPPTVIRCMSSDCAAATLSPAPPFDWMSAPGWIAASTVPLRIRMTAETPTPASLPKAIFPAPRSSFSTVSVASTSRLPPACTVALSSM